MNQYENQQQIKHSLLDSTQNELDFNFFMFVIISFYPILFMYFYLLFSFIVYLLFIMYSIAPRIPPSQPCGYVS